MFGIAIVMRALVSSSRYPCNAGTHSRRTSRHNFRSGAAATSGSESLIRILGEVSTERMLTQADDEPSCESSPKRTHQPAFDQPRTHDCLAPG